MTCSFSKARSLFFSDAHWTIDDVLDFIIKLCGKFTGGSGLCMLELFYLFITVSSEITFYLNIKNTIMASYKVSDLQLSVELDNMEKLIFYYVQHI
jgi:hypothetical protein